jgi:exopolysaccharide biosynthesis polyprenyl glycosylphosphotransferase
MGDAGATSNKTALNAQRLLEVLAFGVAPAAVAGLIGGHHLESFGDGVIILAAVLVANFVLEPERLPLHLMPLATFFVRVAVPVVGMGLALIIFTLTGRLVDIYSSVAPVVGAWLILAFGSWLTAKFENARQIRVAMIGSPGLAIGMAYELHSAKIRSYEVIGWLAPTPPTAQPGQGPCWLGSFEDVREIVEEYSIELLVHSTGRVDGEPQLSRLDLFEHVAAECLDLPVRMIEAGQLYEELLGHVPLGQSNAAWFQYLLHPRYRGGAPISKRIFDLVVGLAMFTLLLPVLGVFAALVKLTDGGPIFYRQRRVGEGGREFEMIKLRSMSVASEEDGAAKWAEQEDDRVTSVGAVMRRLHIDEMPQLWNVLRGDMTIVGPRPERRALINQLELQLPYYDRRHLVKPGLAGWAQACCGYGGSEQGSSWKLCHDLYYLKHRSVYFDFLILLENVRVSFAGVQFGLDAPQEQFILGGTTQS